MTATIEKLLAISSPSLNANAPTSSAELLPFAGPLVDELAEVLRARNGFYAFESALHVYPARSGGGEMGLMEWNATDLWIKEFQGLADGSLYFAQDIFGDQFCIRVDGIYHFNPETAQLDKLAPDLDGWARIVLDDYNLLTGYPLGKEWQQMHGRLAPGSRLLPKMPFVFGGEFSVENLYPFDAVTGMRFRGSIAVQTKDVPDGRQIRLRVVD